MISNVLQPQENISSAVMSGTTKFTSSAFGILYINDFCQQFYWTGNPSGTFNAFISNDYNPGSPITKGKANDGHWSLLSSLTVSGSESSFLLSGLSNAYIRFEYTNTTGSGVLTGWMSGKTQG